MKTRSIITKLLPVLVATALLLLSSCAGNMSKEDMHAWINSQPLLEEFPYPPNVYQLDKPTAKEEKGITITPFQFKEGSYNGVQMSKVATGMNTSSSMVGSIKATNTTNKTNILIVSPVKGTSGTQSIQYTVKENTESKNSYNTVNMNIQTDTQFDLKSKTPELLCEKIVTKTTLSGSAFGGQTSTNVSKSFIGYKDLDTDKILTVGDVFMILVPDKSVKIGDQWEKQIYSETTGEQTSTNGIKLSVTQYTICLNTYTLTGFTNISGKRCAIIGLNSDVYDFSEVDGGRTKEELKQTAKTLSKLTPKTISEFQASKDLSSKFSGAVQRSSKHEGILAYDYQNGIVTDSHSGSYLFGGMGFGKSWDAVSNSKTQSVFKLKE